MLYLGAMENLEKRLVRRAQWGPQEILDHPAKKAILKAGIMPLAGERPTMNYRTTKRSPWIGGQNTLPLLTL